MGPQAIRKKAERKGGIRVATEFIVSQQRDEFEGVSIEVTSTAYSETQFRIETLLTMGEEEKRLAPIFLTLSDKNSPELEHRMIERMGYAKGFIAVSKKLNEVLFWPRLSI